jgi:hypothetical protein
VFCGKIGALLVNFSLQAISLGYEWLIIVVSKGSRKKGRVPHVI